MRTSAPLSFNPFLLTGFLMSISTVQLQGALKRAIERKAGRTYSPASESLTYAERAEKRVNAFLKGFKLRPHGKTVTHLTPKRGRPYPVELADGTTAYMGEPLTAGNSKLDPSVLTFDTPAIVTCGNCKNCARKCYAMKSQRLWADTYNARALHLWLAVKQPEYLESLICAQLEKADQPYVRLHSSGDFFSQSYIDMWARIAAAFPRKRFYFYTKMDCAGSGLDFSAFLALKNVNRVQSVLPDGRVNFGDWDYVQKLIAEGYRLCPYGVREYKARKRAEARADKRGLKGKARSDYIKAAEKKAARPVHCGDKCTLCMRTEKVCFLEH